MNALNDCLLVPRGREVGDHTIALVCTAHGGLRYILVDDVSGMTMALLAQIVMSHEHGDHPPTHGLKSLVREVDSSYTALCQCGFHYTGPNKEIEPDIDARKDEAYASLAAHAVDAWRRDGVRL